MGNKGIFMFFRSYKMIPDGVHQEHPAEILCILETVSLLSPRQDTSNDSSVL